RRPDVAGVAAICGGQPPLVLACRDFDQHGAYERWAEAHPDLAAVLPTTRTRRGHHCWFRLAGLEEFRQLPDGEVRGTRGHYAPLPPSPHPEGGNSQTLIPWRHVGDLPLLDPIKEGLVPPNNPSPGPYSKVLSLPSTSGGISCVGDRTHGTDEVDESAWIDD